MSLWLVRVTKGEHVWGDGLEVESTNSFSIESGLNSQQLHVGSLPPLSPVLGDSMPSSSLCEHQTCMCCTDINTQNTNTHTINCLK